ncbi:NAD(P)-dependent oxidoreductase [Chryseobacterium chendengshani]|uniref:NAD-dependent epimerase/dehydratase family protein n=1 Tax=Chryseobacterium sp. LJ668 TaxID=2864040 RepID=UPI001C691686|nr:NAD(P)-dependent oxidoreductase [Chryseobacterium sp. LJ668]MBW8523173.1 NAD(P)-dependent oxidoreductase [Chryseobacterium sp. LJ668]QYK15470.1 NAD(P)-dependent oxidoreductase [Chryseobacterium sp. LJ668]
MASKCAVVGANGFLGAVLTKKLIEKNYSVTAVYNNGYSNINAETEKLNIVDFIKSKDQFDFIFLSLGNYKCNHQELIEINNIIQTILENNNSAKIIFISSTNVYGIHKEVIDANSAFNNPTLYPLSKLAGEFIVSAHEKYAILRLTYLYGKNLNNGSFLPNVIKKSIETGEIVLFGDGSRKQDYLHVDDAGELCVKAMESKENGIYIGASGISTSNSKIAEIVSAKHTSTIKYVGEELGSSFYFDIKETQERLQWNPEIDIVKGINEMIS